MNGEAAAMTGEITLRGRVWPIAGPKEKLLAALRGGIKTVLIPEQNAKDLVEISESIKKGLEIVLVRRTHVPSGNRPRPDLSDGWSLRKGQRPAARRANFKEPPAPPPTALM